MRIAASCAHREVVSTSTPIQILDGNTRDLHVSGERDLDISQSALRLHVAQGAHTVDYERVTGNGLLESLLTIPLWGKKKHINITTIPFTK